MRNRTKARSRREEYRPCNLTLLLDKIRRLWPEALPLKDGVWIHQANCGSQFSRGSQFSLGCTCAVQLRCGDKLYSL